MFESFYGLRTDPFRLTPDHHFSFNHEQFSRAKAYIDYALVRGEGFVMITGNPGTGKTTLIADLQARLLTTETTTATINCTQLDAEALLFICAYEFGLQVQSNQKAVLLRELMIFFRREQQSSRRVLLIIDEAQDLSVQALEELRLLTNLQGGGRPLLQIILLGQTSLRDLIRRPEMLQVHQRIVAAMHLQPLKPQETVAYVRYRLETAGWSGDPVFEPGVVRAIYAYSEGIPRLINQYCSRLLLRGFSLDRHELTQHDAQEVLRELQEEGLVEVPRLDADQAESTSDTPWSEIDKGLAVIKPPKPPEPPVAPIIQDSQTHQEPAAPLTPTLALETESPDISEQPEVGFKVETVPVEDAARYLRFTAQPTSTLPNDAPADTDTNDPETTLYAPHQNLNAEPQTPPSKPLRVIVIVLIMIVLLTTSFLGGMVMTDDELRQKVITASVSTYEIVIASTSAAIQSLLEWLKQINPNL
ncbi:ExeA family protein [Halochromatium roseum]|uniref:ExeA family protein n=1 Tax=Halochromatium roseum TaxID=391920 RepID=UPI0019112C94|nr:AAA family ATPase [Halochromatium roseum]MBK5940389.1 hypothetical protein [Halochromatium roseum]